MCPSDIQKGLRAGRGPSQQALGNAGQWVAVEGRAGGRGLSVSAGGEAAPEEPCGGGRRVASALPWGVWLVAETRGSPATADPPAPLPGQLPAVLGVLVSKDRPRWSVGLSRKIISWKETG